MDFAQWLEIKLNKRGWGASDLAKAGKNAGYKISRGQFSHIINGTRYAGPEACIAIAHALELPREEVFRARGWLLPHSPGHQLDPRAEELARKVSALPSKSRELAFDAIGPVLDSIGELTSEIQQLSANGQHA